MASTGSTSAESGNIGDTPTRLHRRSEEDGQRNPDRDRRPTGQRSGQRAPDHLWRPHIGAVVANPHPSGNGSTTRVNVGVTSANSACPLVASGPRLPTVRVSAPGAPTANAGRSVVTYRSVTCPNPGPARTAGAPEITTEGSPRCPRDAGPHPRHPVDVPLRLTPDADAGLAVGQRWQRAANDARHGGTGSLVPIEETAAGRHRGHRDEHRRGEHEFGRCGRIGTGIGDGHRLDTVPASGNRGLVVVETQVDATGHGGRQWLPGNANSRHSSSLASGQSYPAGPARLSRHPSRADDRLNRHAAIGDLRRVVTTERDEGKKLASLTWVVVSTGTGRPCRGVGDR